MRLRGWAPTSYAEASPKFAHRNNAILTCHPASAYAWTARWTLTCVLPKSRVLRAHLLYYCWSSVRAFAPPWIEQSFGKNLHYFDKYHRRWVAVRLAFSFVGYRMC